MGVFDCLLVGHRGTGKSITGCELAVLGWDVVDLDHKIEEASGLSCGDFVAADPVEFRKTETQILRSLVNDTTPTRRIIICGGGATGLPDEALVVWLRRDDWHQTARLERNRLKPDVSFEEEVRWMTATREPMWQVRADFVFDIPVGRSPTRVAEEISDVLTWAKSGGPIAQKTWLIATASPSRLRFLVDTLGLRGVETRSDIAAQYPRDTSLLASLRTPDPTWLKLHAHADVFDIELTFLDQVLSNGVLDDLAPRPVILSAHPTLLTTDVQVELLEAKSKFVTRYPAWTMVQTKCAGPADLSVFEQLNDLDTILPTSSDQNWLRTLNTLRNTQNYVAPGLKPSRITPSTSDGIPPMDLQDWVMHFGQSPSSIRAALVGHPIENSQGPWWHRKTAEAAGQSVLYLKVPTRLGELNDVLKHLQRLEVTRISVTSPLKFEASAASKSPLPALNTLYFAEAWTGTDTDATGAVAALQEVLANGLTQGSVLVIGTGGVAAAVLRAIDASGFGPVIHLPGRHDAAWPETDLVINTSGRKPHNPPHPRVWVDLHYNGVEAIDGPVHLGGDTFFAGQAHAQRRFWQLED